MNGYRGIKQNEARILAKSEMAKRCEDHVVKKHNQRRVAANSINFTITHAGKPKIVTFVSLLTFPKKDAFQSLWVYLCP